MGDDNKAVEAYMITRLLYLQGYLEDLFQEVNSAKRSKRLATSREISEIEREIKYIERKLGERTKKN